MSAQRSASRSASRGRSSSGPWSSSISKVLQASGMKDVIIGKDKRSVILPSLPSLTALIHSRQNAFYRFSDELLRLEDDHTPAELMSVLQQVIPITSLVLCNADALDACTCVLDAPFKVENLSFNKLWKKVLKEPFDDFEHFNDSAKRRAGLSAVQFECNIPVSDILPSESTLQDHVMFFTLELPTQARTRNWDDDGTPISDVSTVSTPARHTRAPGQSHLNGVACNLFQTPTRSAATTPPSVTPTPPAQSKLDAFLAKTPAANVNPGDVSSYGYFDKLDFLENQTHFHDIFGFRPKLLASDAPYAQTYLLLSLNLLTEFSYELSLPLGKPNTLDTYPLTDSKRSKDVTVDESTNEIIPPASEDSEDLQFAEEGDAVCVIIAQLSNTSLHQHEATIAITMTSHSS
ncbi:predicted protein [Chaetoceros tenuissimus]|uniref:Uncharacterized protein n=1 Tax=Chaetoceros tenuissimus TaxID=426638 RepID=A0AAD3D9X5_9STRA|nr:predicted protein [Chaetoceros tenuissimus]